ncbi:hypothetical protein F5884DRAFT_776959 [Xylogone sp. PMI_703]|nr:hypothetical protein F5884DRAFT_776959 [Xylogone sp. PMI_703]
MHRSEQSSGKESSSRTNAEHIWRCRGSSRLAWRSSRQQRSGNGLDRISRQTEATAELCNDLTYETQEALNYLWSRPYWSRAWVVQELASARRSRSRCTFRCGSRTVSYNVFQKFLSGFLSKVFFTKGDPVLEARRMLTLSSSGSRVPFLEVLWESAHLKSTDPRDRIYGIRGICPQYYRDTIKVDYSLEFHKLCSRFMAYHIKKERSLDILCCFHKFPFDSQYPSWLCDLRNRSSGISPLTFSASADRLATANIANGILHAKGIQISVVEEVKGPYQLPPLTATDIFSSYSPYPPSLEEMEELAFATLQMRYPAESHQLRESRFWHMVAGNQHEVGGISKLQFQDSCSQLWRRYCEIGLIAGGGTWEDRRNFSFIFERLLGRCFFTTSDQHIGLGPPDLKRGDAVCILYGCSVCIILRKTDLGYSFVGSVYVDGAMSGDYVRFKSSEENRLKETKFSIR